MIPVSLTSDVRIVASTPPTTPPIPEPQYQWYAVMHDKERYVWGLDYLDEPKGYLWREALPEVYFCQPLHAVDMTQEVQKLCYGLFRFGAPSMSEETAKKKYRIVYADDIAFANFSGFPHAGTTPRRDYINNVDLEAQYPRLDKPRFCGGALIRGTVVGDSLLVNTIDSQNLPTLEEVIRDRLYFTAVSVEKNFASDFAQGLGEPVYIPLISKLPVLYPLKFLRKLPLGYNLETHNPHAYVV